MKHDTLTAAPPLQVQPKVYSYTRWSTPEQAKGDSFRRQAEAAAKWARSKGLVLDETLAISDAGVSAYRGSNAGEDGGLGRFIEACRAGEVQPGSILLVESLDRISRLPPMRALRLFGEITDAGVEIVTLSDGQTYNAHKLATDTTSLIIALMVAIRAHEESRTKGRRVAEAWREKRRKVRAGEAARLTCRAPAWLLPDGEGWKLDEPKAETVRRIYRMALAGNGEHKIAETFNVEGLPVLGRGKLWHRSTISKVLRNPAVIGTLVPGYLDHTDGKTVHRREEPVPNAFPAVVAEADWLAVRALKDGNAAAIRGRHAANGVAHLLAGLAKCPECGSTMTRVQKGCRSRPKLVCTKAKGKAGCRYVSVPVAQLEEAFLRDWGALYANVPAGGASSLDSQFDDLDASVVGLEDLLQDLTEALAASPSHALASRVARTEAELRLLRREREEMDERRRLADHGLVHARLDALHERLNPEEGELDRTAANTALKVLFSAVTVDYGAGLLRFHWRQGGEASILYDLPAGFEREAEGA